MATSSMIETRAKAVVDGHIINDGTTIGCGPGSELLLGTFGANEPVAVAIRFLQREPTSAEKDHLDLTPSAEEAKLEKVPEIPAVVVSTNNPQPVNRKPQKTKSVDAVNALNPAGPWKNGDVVSNMVAPKVAGIGFEISAEIDPTGLSGAIITQGGAKQGYALYLKEGKLTFSVRENGKTTTIAANDPLGKGHFTVLARIQKDGTLALLVDGRHVAAGKAAGPIPEEPKTAVTVGSANRVAIGDYTPPYTFSGKINNVTVKAAVEK